MKYIKAECHSDDRKVEISFDATAWFSGATEDEIVALADCGWYGDYPADVVAEHYHDSTTKLLFDYLHILRDSRDAPGFECSVDEEDAIAWIEANRADIFEKYATQFGWDLT